jgi:dolichol-phosphate mannosyltransferase
MTQPLRVETEAIPSPLVEPGWSGISETRFDGAPRSPTVSRSARARAASSQVGDGPAPPPEFSIVLACFNEHENLPLLLAQIAGLGLSSYEVVVVDDGSTDGTREFLKCAAATGGEVRCIFNETKQTLTIAHLQGIQASRGKFVIVMDSDLQHPARSIPRLVDRLRAGSDVVVASRYLAGGSVGGRPPIRGVISRTATLIAQTILPETRGLSDPISGFFGFRREIFRSFDRRYRGYETILFVLMMSRGRPVSEVAYPFQPRSSGESQITQNFGFVRVFLTQVLLAIRFRQTLDHQRTRPPLVRPSGGADARPEAPTPRTSHGAGGS